jgi:hypothetical protein
MLEREGRISSYPNLRGQIALNANLTVIAKSDKHTGYCVAAIDEKGRFIRLVRDEEGHALAEEQCGFKKLDRILVDITHAPLKHQRENYILNELLNVRPPILVPDSVVAFLQKPAHIFTTENPWLTEEEMLRQRSTFLFAEVTDLHIYENDEEKHKADFIFRGTEYKGFSITDPAFKTMERRIKRAALLFSLPDAAYTRYGNELYYKFICAVYPLKTAEKAFELDCYRIGGQRRADFYDWLYEEKCA